MYGVEGMALSVGFVLHSSDPHDRRVGKSGSDYGFLEAKLVILGPIGF